LLPRLHTVYTVTHTYTHVWLCPHTPVHFTHTFTVLRFTHTVAIYGSWFIFCGCGHTVVHVSPCPTARLRIYGLHVTGCSAPPTHTLRCCWFTHVTLPHTFTHYGWTVWTFSIRFTTLYYGYAWRLYLYLYIYPFTVTVATVTLDRTLDTTTRLNTAHTRATVTCGHYVCHTLDYGYTHAGWITYFTQLPTHTRLRFPFCYTRCSCTRCCCYIVGWFVVTFDTFYFDICC